MGLEFYALTDDPLEKIPTSWLWDLVWYMSQFAAQHGGIASILDDLGLMSSALFDVRIPSENQARFINDKDQTGILLGLPHPKIPSRIKGPLGEIRLVNVKLLTLDELDYLLEHEDAGRAELAKRFAAQGALTESSLLRPSVV